MRITEQDVRQTDAASQQGDLGRTPQTWKLVVSYDGSDFFGWQVQPGLCTVQGELARVIREVTGESLLPQGSGRTDTGVHAEGQVVSFALRAAIPPDRLQRALNRKLPGSIRIMSAEVAAAGFHARGGVASKVYTYRVFPRRLETGVERICQPMLARTVWDCRWPLRIEWMQQAAQAVIGTHDFTSFAASDPDRTARMKDEPGGPANVRTIFRSEWTEEDGLYVYRVCGSGFLHHMVRNLVGTFVEVGTGRRPPDSLPAVLAGRCRTAAGATAPPQGLSLTAVQYKSNVFREDAGDVQSPAVDGSEGVRL